MASQKKLRVAVFYGGRSGEHEVSLRSAASVIRNLDRERFEVIPVAIDKKGRWLLHDLSLIEKAGDSLPVSDAATPVILPPNPSGQSANCLIAFSGKNTGTEKPFDVIFPVMHGPLCEDGTIQGLFELAEVAYVGCGVLASSVGMDKEVAKRLARDAGVPIVPFVSVKDDVWYKHKEKIAAQVKNELGYPVFVKPANMGSSVGVHKVKDAAGLAAALEDAFRYDTKVLVEESIDAREIEIAVLENHIAGEEALTTVPGEIAPTHEFYSYEAKYLDENGAALMIPAKLNEAQMRQAQEIARKAFAVLEGEGLARCDLFLDRKSGKFYFNEVNTLPGFTSISMYPKLWEASGIGYKDLLTRLIDLALRRHEKKRKLSREYLPD